MQVIGRLNYLEKSTRPDIVFATQQCARFCADARQLHADAIKWLGCYLTATRDKGMILDPNSDSSDVYADADFAGAKLELWQSQQRKLHCKVKTWIHHHVCRMSDHLSIKLQTQIALSSTKSEFIGLSMALQTNPPTV